MAQDSISLALEAREVTGKSVKHLRKQGTIPAVIHDHGKPSIILQGDGVAMLKAYRQAGKHHPIELTASGKKYVAMIKTAEFEPRKHMLNHIVFNAVSAGQKVEADIPIHPRYDEGNESSPAERNGLIVLSQLETVQVKAEPSKLPDVLTYDAEKLVEIGDHATVADLIIPADVELLTEPGHTIATVYEPSALAAANDSAGGDAVEEDAETVESEAGSAETDDQTSGEDELRPGGKKEAEDNTQAQSPSKE
jgi:large subunit ribosomal protein L25